MKVVMWLLGAAVIAVLAYGLVMWRRRREALRRASEERSAALMAEVMAATRSRPAQPQSDRDLVRAADFAKAAESARVTDAAKAANFANAADLKKQRLLFDAAAKAGEAGEPVLSIQLYARLLARYPDSTLAAQARAAVEMQKKNVTKA